MFWWFVLVLVIGFFGGEAVDYYLEINIVESVADFIGRTFGKKAAA